MLKKPYDDTYFAEFPLQFYNSFTAVLTIISERGQIVDIRWFSHYTHLAC